MKPILKLVAGMARDRGQRILNIETVVECVKSGCVVGAFLLNLKDYAEE